MSRKQSSTMAHSLTDLPSNIIVEILVRLPLKTLFVVRSICKTFLSLIIPDSHFIGLHSSKAAQTLVFQFGGTYKPSHLLCLAEPELDIFPNLVLKPLFQLPKIGTGYNLHGTSFRKENKFLLSNSCNGLVYFVRRHTPDESSLVCNPVTNEYFIIPDVDKKIRLDYLRTRSMWLGFCPGSNQYKVLRIFSPFYGGPVGFEAQVFVIGSSSWRDLGVVPLWSESSDYSWDLCSAFLSGVMYWTEKSWSNIKLFDFKQETFGEVAFPSEFGDGQLRSKCCMSIGVLGGCLCLSYNDFDAQHVDLWIMRKMCGGQESWNKEFVVDTVRHMGRPVYGRFKPLQILGNGEIVMLWLGNYLVCYNPKTKSLRYVGFHRLRLRLTAKAVVLTPSFVPLKETLKVYKVLNQYVRPRGDETEL